MAETQIRKPAPRGNVVALPGAARERVRQPTGGASASYRRAHPWPGLWHEPVPPDDGPAHAFASALTEVAAARAFADWTGAQSRLAHLCEAPAAQQAEVRAAHWEAFAGFRLAVELLARTPAPDRCALARKVETIGRRWLQAEGNWYDTLRAGVQRDRERLGVINPVPTVPKRRRGG